MKKDIKQISIETTTTGTVEIKQEWNDMNFDDPIIEIVPEQIDILISWLHEAKKNC
ncbi:MAG: hypothetical protein QM484_14855 [Woeseiaceae bacterium]